MIPVQQVSRQFHAAPSPEMRQAMEQVPRRDQQRVRPQSRPEPVFEPVEAPQQLFQVGVATPGQETDDKVERDLAPIFFSIFRCFLPLDFGKKQKYFFLFFSIFFVSLTAKCNSSPEFDIYPMHIVLVGLVEKGQPHFFVIKKTPRNSHEISWAPITDRGMVKEKKQQNFEVACCLCCCYEFYNWKDRTW